MRWNETSRDETLGMKEETKYDIVGERDEKETVS